MKINLLSFTDYKLKIDLYYKKNMDFFSYLLLKIITKEEKENRTLKEILLDFDITESLMYLVESAFYHFIDNHLIECDDDLSKVKHQDIIINDLAYKCLKNQYILEFEQTVEKEVSLDPINHKFVFQTIKSSDDYVIYNKIISREAINEMVNASKEKLFNDLKDYELQVEILEANPLLTETEIKDYPNLEFQDILQEIILDNLQFYDQEAKKDYQKDLVILTKEYSIAKDNKYDFIATLNNDKYGCFYYEIASNIGKIPMIKRTKLK